MERAIRRATWVATVLAVAACGGVNAPSPVRPTPAGTTGPDGTVGDTVQMLAAVRAASVRLEVRSTTLEPGDELETTVDGTGSGFLVSDDGLVVTNLHVVGGATSIRANVGGGSTALDAELVAASECADLAVIRLDSKASRPFLSWYDGPIEVGLEVFSTGYPQGDTRFTASRGIVSVVDAEHDFRWSSPQRVLQHDADQFPGHSGSPLVATDGRVVAVAWANSDDDTVHYAVDRDVARPIVEELITGRPVESIGITGEAWARGALTGIWVTSVMDGSRAARAGVEPGDVITRLGDQKTAGGGSIHDLCATARRAGTEDPLTIRVVRLDPLMELTGELGGRVLAPTTGTPDLGLDGSYDSFETVTDEGGVIELEVPDMWADRDGREWITEQGTDYGPSLIAAVDIDSFWDTWSSSGVFVSWSSRLASEYDPEGYLQSLAYEESCRSDGGPERRFVAGVLGIMQRYRDCGAEEVETRVFVGEAREHLLTIEAQLLTEADVDAFERAVRTLTLGD